MPALNENIVNDLVKRGVINDTFRRLQSDKKERVYRTTLRLIGEYGYDGLSVDLLCRQAGISKGSFFQYFPGKSNLLEFSVIMFDDYLKNWVDALKEKETAVHARDRILYLYDSLIAGSRLYPVEHRFLRYVTMAAYHSAVTIQGIDIERHLRSYLTDIVTRGGATGELRRDIQPEPLVELILAVFNGLIQRQSNTKRASNLVTREELLTMLFDGVKG